MVAGIHDKWVRRFHPAPDAVARLVCLPHAGGSASFYFPVSRALAPGIEVLAIQYPGRQERRHEPFAAGIHAMADQVTRLLTSQDNGLPLMLFGHSMGAMIAYEVACRLEGSGIAVDTLFVSGRRAPSRYRKENVHERSDDGILAEIRELAGTEMNLLGDEDLVHMILPALRSDYRAVETYEYTPRYPLKTPIVAFAGTEDPRVTVDEVESWSGHTGSSFELHALSGGHFFLAGHQNEILRAITDRVVPVAERGWVHA